MIWLALAKRWAGPLLIVAAIAGAYAYHRVQLNAAHREGYRAAEAVMADQVVKANAATAALEQRQRQQSAAAAASWESKRAQLESQVAGLLSKPRPAIRLCHDSAGGGQVPIPAGTPSGPDGRTGGQVDALRLRDDLSGAILVRASTCERYRQQLSALQDWIREAR